MKIDNLTELRFIDLSVSLSHNIQSEEIPPMIKYINHKQGGLLLGLGLSWKGKNIIKKIFNFIMSIFKDQIIKLKDFPDRMGLSTEIIKLSSHTGTHVDSPYHYGPKLHTIDKAKLNYFFSNGVILDFRGKTKIQAVTKNDIVSELKRINYTLKKNDIVLLQFGADKNWGKGLYLSQYCGLSVEGLKYLLDNQIKVIGTDAFGLDMPFEFMKEEYLKNNRDRKYLWPVHFYGRIKEYYMIEKMANLDRIGQNKDFIIAVFPVKISNASAAWARAVAII